MREATLYQLNTSKVQVAEACSAISVREAVGEIKFTNQGEWIYDTGVIKDTQIPINRVVNTVNGKQEDFLVCIDPAALKVIDLVYNGMLVAAEARAASETKNAHKLSSRLQEERTYSSRLFRFKDLPLWRRIILAITNAI